MVACCRSPGLMLSKMRDWRAPLLVGPDIRCRLGTASRGFSSSTSHAAKPALIKSWGGRCALEGRPPFRADMELPAACHRR